MKKSETTSVEDKIICSALTVLTNKTISGTRMHLIADEAGMGASNIHYYFKTKQDLLLAVLDEIQRRSTTRRLRIMAGENQTLKGKLSGFFASKREMILEDREVDIVQFDLWVQGLADEPLKARFQQSFGIWRGDIIEVLDEFLPDMPEKRKNMIAYTMISMMMGASMQYHNNPKQLDLDDYFSTCIEMLLNMMQ